MSWFAKAKENHARSMRAIRHGRFFAFGAVLTLVGGYGLYSDVRHQIHGKPATATFMEHIKQCTVEYQRIGEPERKEQWPCELAEEFQKRVGSNKVKLSRDYIARVQFPLANGRTQESSVDEIKLNSYKLAIGATLPVIYDPDNPADVRAVLSWERLRVGLIMLAIGVPCLALAFGVPFGALFGWAFRARASRTGDDSTPDKQPTPTTIRASELRDGGNRRQDTVVTPRPIFGMRNR